MQTKNRSLILLLLIIFPLHTLFGQSDRISLYQTKIDSIVRIMTLEEKIGQLVQYSYTDDERADSLIRDELIGSFLNAPRNAEETNKLQRIAVEDTRLGIPLIFGFDVIHGVKTIFPIPLAEAATWDVAGVEKTATFAAREAAALGIHWTFSPMVDIARDPRWGRIAEGSGEDPYLGSRMATARVRGFQGHDYSAPDRIVACPKHYVAYGAAEGGRDYNTVDISERTLRDVYLPPFKAAVDAGAGTLMSAFNDLNGIPASSNRHTLTEILREEWGFDGFVVSDWNSIGELVNHGVAASLAEASTLALHAGVDMDMEGGAYLNHLHTAVKESPDLKEWINIAVKRILRIKYRLGLFENPYTDIHLADDVVMHEDHIQHNREIAGKSIVLLKNENRLLPLRKRLRSLAVIGPLADSRTAPLGTWSGDGKPENVVTVLAGIREKLTDKTTIYTVRGCDVNSSDTSGFKTAVQLAEQSDATIVVLGEDADMSGEGHSRAHLTLPGVQSDLLRRLYGTGKPIILVLLSGRPLVIQWASEHISAILITWHLGLQHGHAVADVLIGDVNPSGKLPVTFPRATGQVPIHYNHLNTGRPAKEGQRYTMGYVDLTTEPMYPFGFGLSYTQFTYSRLHIDSDRIDMDGELRVRVDVSNTGNRIGEEVVQLYVRDLVARLTRPIRELKGFQRISLKPKETRTVEFTLRAEHLGFHQTEGLYIVEPGQFRLWIGPNSREGLEADFYIEEF